VHGEDASGCLLETAYGFRLEPAPDLIGGRNDKPHAAALSTSGVSRSHASIFDHECATPQMGQ
jgi:hypothetical protein